MDKEVYIRALAREREARKEAERILEEKALQLFESNKKLNDLLKTQTNDLNKTKEKYQNIFETAFDGIVFISKEGDIIDYNRTFKEMLGYNEEEMKNVSISTLVHPDDIEKSQHYITQLNKNGYYKDYRGRIFGKDKKIIHIEVNSIALREDGEIVGSIDVVRDISGRIETENLLFAAGQRFNALFENSPLGIVINSMNGEYLDVNTSMLNILGYSKEELLSTKLYDIVHLDEWEDLKNKIFEIREGNKAHQSLENRFKNKQGELVWVKITATIIEDMHGGQTQIVSLVEDITAWKVSNMLLEENEEKWRHVINNMELGLMEVDIDGKATRVYDRFCELTGYSREELLGEIPLDVLVQDKKYRDIFKKNLAIRQQGKNSTYELEITKKNGESAWLLISGAPLKDEKQNTIGSIGIHMDISPRKKMLHDLELAKKMAEESSKAKENFLANMSHEIRTPMNAVIGMTRLLKESKSEFEKTKYLDAIESSSQNLLVIINDILDISKIEANKLELEAIPFSLSKVLNDLEQLLSYKTEEKGILLTFNIDKEIHTNLIGDSIRLSQILTNLLSNAIKFTKEGQVKCEVTILEDYKDKVKLKFVISDNGIGISHEKLEKIFESFTQEDQTTSREFGGTGLGLTITKNLVELQGGKISVSSKKGEGTSFDFDLTYLKNFEEVKDVKEEVKIQNLLKMREKKVLLVEDHEINKLLAVTILSNWKMNVTHAYNGQEAIDLLKTEEFDVVLMDVQMPVLDGLSATKIIREMNISTPIIALTANAIKGDQEKCLNAGMNDYVSKPIEPSTLFNKIIFYINDGQ